MAKLKPSAKRKTAQADTLQSKADKLSRSLAESAQQIWLAGVGAFGRAQEEGTRLFEALVKEGSALERSTRKFATGGVEAVRGAVESQVGQARDRAADTWDRLEKVFEERVQKAMNRLGVPGRDEINSLVQRVDTLTAELRRFGRVPAAKTAGSAKPASKALKKRAAKAAGKSAAKKTSASRRRTLPKSPKPVAPNAG